MFFDLPSVNRLNAVDGIAGARENHSDLSVEERTVIENALAADEDRLEKVKVVADRCDALDAAVNPGEDPIFFTRQP
jgi:hypothetical protein